MSLSFLKDISIVILIGALATVSYKYYSLNNEYNKLLLDLSESNAKLLKKNIEVNEKSLSELSSSIREIDVSKLELATEINTKVKTKTIYVDKKCTESYDGYASPVLIETLEKIK